MAVVVGGKSTSLVGMAIETNHVIETPNKTKVMLYKPFFSLNISVIRKQDEVMKVGMEYAH